jgi:hypothetical protein
MIQNAAKNLVRKIWCVDIAAREIAVHASKAVTTFLANKNAKESLSVVTGKMMHNLCLVKKLHVMLISNCDLY